MAKISVNLDDELYRRIRDAAGPNGVSGWLAGAAKASLRTDALRAVSAAREAEFVRLEAQQPGIREGIDRFSARNRLDREELHGRAVR
jgi:hypothetical protein